MSRHMAWPPARHCSHGNTIHVSYLPCNYPLLYSAFRRLWISSAMHYWLLMLRQDSSHPPGHVAYMNVQLIKVSKCGVSTSLYNRWLRPEPTQPSPSDRDQASQVIAVYSWRSDHDQMLIQASPTRCWACLTIPYDIAIHWTTISWYSFFLTIRALKTFDEVATWWCHEAQPGWKVSWRMFKHQSETFSACVTISCVVI